MGLTSAQLDVIDLTPRIGSEIRTDLDTLLSGAEAPNIRATLEQRGVVFFRGLEISDEQQVAIAKTLGTSVQNEGESGIYKISLDKNVNQRAEYLKGSMFWHFDGSLQPYPNLATLLRAIKLSETGGETEFCNTYAAYDDLPQADKELIAELRVVHSAERSQYYVRPEMSYDEITFWQKSPTKACPMVWTHQSGRKSLLLGATADYVIGLPVEESRALLARLRDWATQPQYVYRHQWQPGDLLIWDNTGTMHRVLRVSRRQRPSHAPHDPRGRRAPAVKLGIATPVVTNVAGAPLTWEKDATIEDIGRVAETADRLGYHHMTCSEHIGHALVRERAARCAVLGSARHVRLCVGAHDTDPARHHDAGARISSSTGDRKALRHTGSRQQRAGDPRRRRRLAQGGVRPSRCAVRRSRCPWRRCLAGAAGGAAEQ